MAASMSLVILDPHCLLLWLQNQSKQRKLSAIIPLLYSQLCKAYSNLIQHFYLVRLPTQRNNSIFYIYLKIMKNVQTRKEHWNGNPLPKELQKLVQFFSKLALKWKIILPRNTLWETSPLSFSCYHFATSSGSLYFLCCWSLSSL